VHRQLGQGVAGKGTADRERKILPIDGGLVCLAIGLACAALLQWGLAAATLPGAVLEGLWPEFLCRVASDQPAVRLTLFAVQSEWAAIVVLEAAVAVPALACAVWSLAVAGQECDSRRRAVFLVLVACGVGVVATDIALIWRMRDESFVQGFLSRLLSSLPSEECGHVRRAVVWARMVGEPAAFALGVAMAGTAIRARTWDTETLARRARHLRRLLYVASAALVVGIMMSRSNFTWVLAHWKGPDDATATALAEVVKSGVLQSGVGYSALLAGFFLPARGLLHRHIHAAIHAAIPPEQNTEAAREEWLKANRLSSSWHEEGRQILAVLAPVLAAPVFDALTKL